MAGGRITRTVRVGQLPGEQGSRDNDKFTKGLGVFSRRFWLLSHGPDLSMKKTENPGRTFCSTSLSRGC